MLLEFLAKENSTQKDSIYWSHMVPRSEDSGEGREGNSRGDREGNQGGSGEDSGGGAGNSTKRVKAESF